MSAILDWESGGIPIDLAWLVVVDILVADFAQAMHSLLRIFTIKIQAVNNDSLVLIRDLMPNSFFEKMIEGNVDGPL